MLLLIGILIYSCEKDPIGQQPIHNNKPSPVTNVEVQNIPGGAILTYKVPEDKDLLYIKAVYTLTNGVKSEQRSSLYNNYLKIEGYGSTSPQEVEVVAVDRYRNESEAVKTTIEPLTPPVLTIGESLGLIPDFGGVHAYWENSMKAEISVVLLKKDSNDEYVPLETFYSSMAEGNGTARGLDPIEGEFAVYIQDRWENRSETKYFSLTPIFERMFDKGKFQAINLTGDAGYVAGWEKNKMWDGQKGETLGYSSPGGTGIWPQSVTIDLGVTAQISRIRLYQRTGANDEYIFAEGNPMLFKVFGCQTLDMSGEWGNWDLLMDCESIKPSGLSFGMNSNEDVTRAKEGEDFTNSPLNPKVRYIRILVTRTWAGGDNFQIAELEVYGDDRNESEKK